MSKESYERLLNTEILSISADQAIAQGRSREWIEAKNDEIDLKSLHAFRAGTLIVKLSCERQARPADRQKDEALLSRLEEKELALIKAYEQSQSDR